MISFQIMSLSAIDTFEKFSRLGFKVNNCYSIHKLLEVITSQEFKNEHSFDSSSQTIIDQLNRELRENVMSFVGVVGIDNAGLMQYTQLQLLQSEQIRRTLIDSHVRYLIRSNNVNLSLVEIWLSRLDAHHQAIEVRCGVENQTNRTYLSGRTDYLFVAITTLDKDQRPSFWQNRITSEDLNLGDCMSFLHLNYLIV